MRTIRTLLTVTLLAGLIAGGAALAQDKEKNVAANPVVVIETSEGVMKAELWPDKAPKTVENFLKYVDEGFYAETIFHRVIPGFMIQGGGFTADMAQKSITRPPVVNEAKTNVPNARGTLAMARTNVVDSATAQFFINIGEKNSFLNHRDDSQQGFGYAVFGKVIDGMDVADKIVAVKTASKGMYSDVPVTPVVIKTIKRLEVKK